MPVKFTITITEHPGRSVGMDVELHKSMGTEREAAFGVALREYLGKFKPTRFKRLAVLKDWQRKDKSSQN